MRLRSFLLCALTVAIACSDSTAAAPASYTATLRGTDEVPPSPTSASGVATLAIADNTLSYDVTATGFTAPITVVQLHIGDKTVIGPVIAQFSAVAQSGTIAHGTIDISTSVSYNTLTIRGDSLRTLMNLGLTYVNVHTASFPGGEIRGQVVRK